jgi:hypothetical protein
MVSGLVFKVFNNFNGCPFNVSLCRIFLEVLRKKTVKSSVVYLFQTMPFLALISLFMKMDCKAYSRNIYNIQVVKK